MIYKLVYQFLVLLVDMTIKVWPILLLLTGILFYILQGRRAINKGIILENFSKYIIILNKRSWRRSAIIIALLALPSLIRVIEMSSNPSVCYGNFLCGIELVVPLLLILFILIILIFKIIILIIRFYYTKSKISNEVRPF